MGSTKLMMMCAFLFITGNLLCAFIEGTWLGEETTSVINILCGYQTTDINATGGMSWVSAASGFFTVGLPKMLAWNYSFLEGGWSIFKLILLIPISVGFIWGIIQLFVTVISGIASRFF
jgi:hypothetical protein